MEEELVVFKSEYVEIIRKKDGFYIGSFKSGMPIQDLNKLIQETNEIADIDFNAIRTVIMKAPCALKKFGTIRERIEVEVSDDELSAFVTLNVKDEELEGKNKIALVREIVQVLNSQGIVYGIDQNILLGKLEARKKILVAQGIPPVNGKDSEIHMYELKDPKPEVRGDGKVDHYELNLINRVQKGDWLGDKKDPTPGIAGKSVKGNNIPAIAGKNYPLFYDKSSVVEISDAGMTILYALRSGAVNFNGNKIGVSNHLEIQGNVNFATGNIDFDGYLTVKGSIEDNFAIASEHDIEVLGDYGIGSVREVVSRRGSIYIKGGVAGKNKAIIRSKKDIYTKFVSDATIICEGKVHIGFYCLNSNITAKQVILDSPRGQIIGGQINAEVKVVSSIFGTELERRTIINVAGFNRNRVKERFDSLGEQIADKKNELLNLKLESSIYSNTAHLTVEQHYAYKTLLERMIEVREKLKDLEDEKKSLAEYLRTHGEGEIVVLKKIFPNTSLEIKRISKEIDQARLATTFYYTDGQIKEI